MTVQQCRNDIFSGAHFDEYIADYNYMKAGAIDEDVFRMPDLCDGQKIHKLSHPPALPLRMAALLPSVRIGEGTAHMQPPTCNEAALRQSCARAMAVQGLPRSVVQIEPLSADASLHQGPQRVDTISVAFAPSASDTQRLPLVQRLATFFTTALPLTLGGAMQACTSMSTAGPSSTATGSSLTPTTQLAATSPWASISLLTGPRYACSAI